MKKAGPESGHPLKVLPAEAKRFWSRVGRGDDGECWLWLGASNRGGYGVFNIPRIRPGPLAAHRVAYAVAHGRLPAGRVVMHICDNPPCVNPTHLRLGTQQENQRDMIAKGRSGAHLIRGRRVPCRLCGASRKEQPVRAALCASCARMRAERFGQLAAHRVRAAIIRTLRVIPPADFDGLVAVVGERRAEMFSSYFGIYDRQPVTFREVAGAIGVSAERIRQVVERVQDLLLQEYAMGPIQQKAA